MSITKRLYDSAVCPFCLTVVDARENDKVCLHLTKIKTGQKNGKIVFTFKERG